MPRGRAEREPGVDLDVVDLHMVEQSLEGGRSDMYYILSGRTVIRKSPISLFRGRNPTRARQAGEHQPR